MIRSSTGCPVCNGFKSLTTICHQCGHWYEDRGRIFDALAAYSPYRPIDEMKQTDGYIDHFLNLCPHSLYCPHCGSEEVNFVQEIGM
ncbi:hypothetical protein SAMN05444487_11218 [Marininema mesophilum]|uniref:Uncharacterized protein n=1 Tax=Marininema mesophilum TaxID=1048340 RepID=A0A1H2ZXD4_9BACL|nr:hypothetical protein [Marininema mesophilum]SDX21309.1 hypothetical protein SAMN05444487_11218 [Marininema mesophilum]